MSASRIVRQLCQEASRSPKKAALLVILALVAAYHWLPLLGGGTGGTSHSSPPTGAAAMATVGGPSFPATAADPATRAVQPAGNSAQPGNSESDAVNWERLVEWMSQDPRMEPARCLPGRSDPFRFPAQTTADEQSQSEAESSRSIEQVVEQLQSQLSSTMVGPQCSMAMIAGKAYELDAGAASRPAILVEHDGRKYSFELVEIGPGHVVVERHGKRYRLRVPARKGSGRIVLKTAGS